MTEKQKLIVKEWKKVVLKHPSIRTVAKKVDCSTAYVHKIINLYKEGKLK